jgi:CheY-like chemotaxis protein
MNRPRMLLYVEDDPGSRKVMSVLVSHLVQPVELVIFEDSTDFLKRVHAIPQEIDLFLLDIHVTPNDGFDMLRLLRNDPRLALKMVIALTASVMNEEINRLKEAGFDGVLSKPLSFSTFPDTINRILAGERIWTVYR